MRKAKYLFLIFLFLGLLFISIQIAKIRYDITGIPKERIVYRYIPRTIEELYRDEIYVSDIYEDMFNKPSPWIDSVRVSENPDKEKYIDYIGNQY